jgi:hypothetical protein
MNNHMNFDLVDRRPLKSGMIRLWFISLTISDQRSSIDRATSLERE